MHRYMFQFSSLKHGPVNTETRTPFYKIGDKLDVDALKEFIHVHHIVSNEVHTQTKIQQTNMLVTCQRIVICFYLGWSGSSTN